MDPQYWRPSLRSQQTIKLWETITRQTHVFDCEERPALPASIVRFTRDPELLETASFDGKLAQFFPIEALRLHKDWARSHFTDAKWFYSSGTTSSLKSPSPFSADGLELYRLASLHTFYGMLENFFADPLEVRGICLIPTVKKAPESSLAQMLAWIAEFWNVKYIAEEDLNSLVLDPSRPHWLFATGLQWHALTGKEPFALPPSAVLIETGGTKGQKADLSREYFYDRLSRHFSIPQTRIVSEYGMAEMASQAYDFFNPHYDEAERFFRFPWWIKTWISQGLGQYSNEGEGALALWDPLRIDLPWTLRTQDLAKLLYCRRLKLLGRVPHAVLKGCSLAFEDLGTLEKPQVAAKIPQQLTRSDAERLAKIAHAKRWLRSLGGDQTLHTKLLADFYTPNLVTSALNDLNASLPRTDDEWLTAVGSATGEQYLKTWLFLMPRSHPMAMIYPLVFAYLAGIKAYLRATGGAESAERHLLESLISLPGADLVLLDSDFRLGQTSVPDDVDAIFCFGETKTIREIRSVTSLPVQGFGNYLTFTMVSSLDGCEELLLKDGFSLAQKGCMSSRALIVLKQDDVYERVGNLRDKALQLIGTSLPFDIRVCLDHENMHLGRSSQCKIMARQHLDEPLFPVFQGFPSRDALNPRPFVLPIFQVAEDDFASTLSTLLEKFPDLRNLGLSPDLAAWALQSRTQIDKRVRLSIVGNANISTWDGTHDFRPLFVLTNR
jgi:hypothetical protein